MAYSGGSPPGERPVVGFVAAAEVVVDAAGHELVEPRDGVHQVAAAGTPISTASSSRVSALRHSPASTYFSGSTIETLVALTGGTTSFGVVVDHPVRQRHRAVGQRSDDLAAEPIVGRRFVDEPLAVVVDEDAAGEPQRERRCARPDGSGRATTTPGPSGRCRRRRRCRPGERALDFPTAPWCPGTRPARRNGPAARRCARSRRPPAAPRGAPGSTPGVPPGSTMAPTTRPSSTTSSTSAVFSRAEEPGYCRSPTGTARSVRGRRRSSRRAAGRRVGRSPADRGRPRAAPGRRPPSSASPRCAACRRRAPWAPCRSSPATAATGT